MINTYLLFNGTCEEAFKLYAKVLGGKIETMLSHEGTPAAEHVPPDFRKKILHATMKVGDALLMGSDCPPDRFDKPQGFSVTIRARTTGEAERIYNALSPGGTITMPLSETFWSKKFGMFVDKYGIPWMVNCEEAR